MSQGSQQNPFDTLGQQPEWNDEDKAQFERLDYLIHQVFKQNEAGAELLEIWKESLMMAPSVHGNENSLQIGLAEGRKSFIRDVILTIRKVENE